MKVSLVCRRLCLSGFAVLLVLCAWPLTAPAQAGGGGAAGAGAAGGAAGPGAGAAGHGAAATTNGQTGAPAQGLPQGAAATYAAGASPGVDPRKPPTARPGAYSLAQVVQLARDKNPTLLAAEQNLRGVRAQEVQAGFRANPYLTLYGQNVTLPEEGGENPSNYSVQVSRLFERGEKRRFRLENARAVTAQTQAQLEDTIRQTLLQVRQAFTRMLIAKQAVELSAASLRDFEHQVDIGLDRYKAGDLGKLDYERLDLQLGSFESDESNGIVLLRQASDQLQTLIGIALPGVDFDITGDIVPPNLTQTREQLLAQALANRPDLRASSYAVTAAQASVKLAQANGKTDPTLEAEYDRTGVDNSFGASVNIPLRLFDRNQGSREATRFLASASQYTQAAARNQVGSDVDQAWVAYSQAKRLSDRFGEHYLDESRDVLDIAQFAFQHGGLALIDYLDALREARTSTSDALNAYLQTWQAIHQLSAASATDLVP